MQYNSNIFSKIIKFLAGNNISEHVAGDLPVVISCASLALADAGIMMYDLVASVSVVGSYSHLQSAILSLICTCFVVRIIFFSHFKPYLEFVIINSYNFIFY